MSMQAEIGREMARREEREARQVFCCRCDELIRDLEPGEKPPVNPWCRTCIEGELEDVEAETDEAWDEAWVAMYHAAQEEDRFRRIRAERKEAS